MSNSTVEVWKNTAAGFRWYQAYDSLGRETTKIVRGTRTFTLTPMERNLNQDMAASPDQDLFRDGTFVLVRAADGTNMVEIESPLSMTEAEVREMVSEIMGGLPVAEAISDVTSVSTLDRIIVEAVSEGMNDKDVKLIRAKRDAKAAPLVTVREVVTTAVTDG